MHDPHGLEMLPGPVWDLASPAEVRRRGDSRVRRRRVASAVAGVAVVALAATSMAAVTGLLRSGDPVAGDGSRDPSSRQDSTGGGHALAGVDLTSGMRSTPPMTSSGRADRISLGRIAICGATAWSDGQVSTASDVEVASGL